MVFVSWLITISLFLICIYATYIIINGLKEKDQYDLGGLQAQLQSLYLEETKLKKQVS